MWIMPSAFELCQWPTIGNKTNRYLKHNISAQLFTYITPPFLDANKKFPQLATHSKHVIQNNE